MTISKFKDANRRKASHDEGKLAQELGRTKKKQREQKTSKNLLEKQETKSWKGKASNISFQDGNGVAV